MNQPKKTNWLLWILVGGAVVVVAPIACCAGFGFMGFSAVKAPLEAASTALEQDDRVTSVIGSPISYDNIVITDFQNNNGTGSAGLDSNFTGPEGSVHVKGKMKLVANEWSVDQITVTFGDGNEITIP